MYYDVIILCLFNEVLNVCPRKCGTACNMVSIICIWRTRCFLHCGRKCVILFIFVICRYIPTGNPTDNVNKQIQTIGYIIQFRKSHLPHRKNLPCFFEQSQTAHSSRIQLKSLAGSVVVGLAVVVVDYKIKALPPVANCLYWFVPKSL